MLPFTLQRVPVLLALGAAFLLGACQSAGTEGHSRIVAATDGLTACREAAVLVKSDAAAAGAALNALLENPSADPKPQFKTFVSKVDSLAKRDKSFGSTVAKMHSAMQAHLKAWQEQNAQINDEDIREQAEERREGVVKAGEKLQSLAKDVSDASAPMLTMFRDVQKYLNNDLSPEGIASAKSMVKKAGSMGGDLAEAVDDLTERIDEVVARMQPGSEPAPKKP